MIPASAAIPFEVRERIVAAAAALVEQSGRQAMPPGAAVRRAARVDMHAASSVMKEWRRAQTAQAAPVVVAVPEPVQQAGSAAVAAIWLQAQELANESLRSAQTAWEAERGELDAMRQELAEAFERQASELEAVGAALAAENAAAEKQAQQLAAVRQQLADAVSRADKVDARFAEIEHRATDLRAELEKIMAEVTVKVNQEAERLNRDARQRILASGTSEIHPLTAQQRADWREAMQPVWQKFRDNVGADFLQAAEASNRPH